MKEPNRKERTMTDKRNSERHVFALVLILAILLAALTTGCAGINFRHMKVGKITIPDDLYVKYRRVAGPQSVGYFQEDPFGTRLPAWRRAPGYNAFAALRQVNELAAWARDRGYDCEAMIVGRKGWRAVPILAVKLEEGTLYFCPGLQRISTEQKWKAKHILLNPKLIQYKET